MKLKNTPAALSHVLKQHSTSAPHDKSFDYHSVIGMLTYPNSGSQSNIAYVIHQCAQFSIDLKVNPAKVVQWIGWYLKEMCNKRQYVEA